MATWQDELARWLEVSPVFGSLDAKERRRLVEDASLFSVPDGGTLWRQGEVPNEIDVVLEGQLEVVFQREGEAVRYTRTFRPGDVVGLSTVAGEPRRSSLVAVGAVRYAAISGRVLHDLLMEDASRAIRIIASLGDLVGTLRDEQAALVHEPLEARVREALRAEGGDGRTLHITHGQLADHIGAERRRVTRVLRRLEEEGLLHLALGRIQVQGDGSFRDSL